jgi:alkanesulfonate monooxygenase SsuD/methylene tetrahydromethanopterin reductase-like flavin-dependent oxidoreductase (luciferase family)
MKVGLQLASFTWPGGAPEIGRRLAEVVRTAEQAGFHSLWVMDHYFQIPPWG